jgi:hypothetical protein
MPKLPLNLPSGFYHVSIPIADLENGTLSDSSIKIRPISKERSEQLERRFRKVNRNQPCPCGSGVKYKRCCMRDAN